MSCILGNLFVLGFVPYLFIVIYPLNNLGISNLVHTYHQYLAKVLLSFIFIRTCLFRGCRIPHFIQSLVICLTFLN